MREFLIPIGAVIAFLALVTFGVVRWAEGSSEHDIKTIDRAMKKQEKEKS